jgi:hypothetical protein
MKKPKSILLLSAFLIQICAMGQYTNYPSYYSNCIGADCITNGNYIYGIYQIDTLARNHEVKEKVEIIEQSNRGENKLIRSTQVVYDEQGRKVKTYRTSQYGNYSTESDYATKNKIISKSSYSYSERRYNDSSQIISNLYVIKKKDGTTQSMRLSKSEYNHHGKLTSMQTSYKKKDTTLMRYRLKRYYRSDSGELTKIEYFNKGKISHTYVYDCDLTNQKAPPKKDSTRVCKNEATDDRGYTYYTSFSENQNRLYKTTHVYDPKNKLVESSQYIIKDGQELPFNIYRVNNDSSYNVSYQYNSNLKKVTRTISRTNLYNPDKTISNSQIKITKKGKTDLHYIYFKYYKNGLMKESFDEFINHKSKVKRSFKQRFYYSFFNS